ncbi:HU family DNA-binding protein [Thaumasiovibrio sp. DFM-14]|uniref:HU family DNA-binding protein n=1 Tax=Thaumasiovibrio sp. DFM-14 TaxID=3384792 RepID=UPI0039A14115
MKKTRNVSRQVISCDLALLLARESGKPAMGLVDTCESFVSVFFDELRCYLKHGESVDIEGFGIFRHQRVAERDGAGFLVGKVLPAATKVRFEPASKFKQGGVGL